MGIFVVVFFSLTPVEKIKCNLVVRMEDTMSMKISKNWITCELPYMLLTKNNMCVRVYRSNCIHLRAFSISRHPLYFLRQTKK